MKARAALHHRPHASTRQAHKQASNVAPLLFHARSISALGHESTTYCRSPDPAVLLARLLHCCLWGLVRVGGCVVATDLLLESATVQEQTQHSRIEKARRNLGLVDASSKNAPSAYKSVGCGSVGRVVSWPYINRDKQARADAPCECAFWTNWVSHYSFFLLPHPTSHIQVPSREHAF